jgi:uncharacterized protein YkwD
VVVIAAIGPAEAQPAAADDPNVRFLALVNAERAKAGQPALTLEPRLTMAACWHAIDLARGGPLSHRGSDGSGLGDRLARSGYPFAMAAENLAAGITTPDETVWLWSGSPGHRRNMLTAEFGEAGVAHRTAAGGDVWVLVLGTRRVPAGDRRKENIENTVQSDDFPDDLRGDNAITCY